MGIDPSNGSWACWRNSAHRGAGPQRLVAALKYCTWDEAEAIVNDGAVVSEIGYDKLFEMANGLFTKPKTATQVFETMNWPDEIQSFRSAPDFWKTRFQDYMIDDWKVSALDFDPIVTGYRLRYSTTGDYANRIIFPIYYNKQLIGWTGRAITESKWRYLSQPVGDTIKRVVYNHDEALLGGPTLALVEGPKDTVKLDFYGKPFGVTAVGLLGVSTIPAQLAVVAKLARRFDRVVSLLDDDALSQSMNLSGQLGCEVMVGQLGGSHDPGAMYPREIQNLLGAPPFV